MASKYGTQLYGKDLYSSSMTGFTGAVFSISVGMSGRIGESEPLVSTVSVPITMQGRATRGRAYSHIYTATSKYGDRIYGEGLYSRAERAFIQPGMEGKLADSNALGAVFPVPITFIGNIGESEPLASTSSISMSMIGILGESEPLASVSSISIVMSGKLTEDSYLASTLNVPIVMQGRNTRARTYSHIYTATSKYGDRIYGEGLYSRAERAFVQPGMEGKLADSNALKGSIAVPITFSGTDSIINPLSASDNILITMNGGASRLGLLESASSVNIVMQGFNTRIRSYSHIYTATFKYGDNIYGNGLYSQAEKAFIQLGMNGVSSRIRIYEHIYIPVTKYGMGAYGVDKYARESIFIRPIMGGVLNDTDALAGNFTFTLTFISDLSLKGAQLLEGNLPIVTAMFGDLIGITGFVSASFNIIVDLFGDLSETEAFWVPDDARDENWVPDVPSEPMWTPDSPNSGAWGPAEAGGTPWAPSKVSTTTFTPVASAGLAWSSAPTEEAFWVPDTPKSGSWNPSAGGEEPWVGQDSVNPPWVPIGLKRKKNG